MRFANARTVMILAPTAHVMTAHAPHASTQRKQFLDYKPQKKFPKVWISQITQVCPDLETKRKVSPDEDEK